MRLINLLVKVVSCARKRGCAIKREGAVFGTFTVFDHSWRCKFSNLVLVDILWHNSTLVLSTKS